MAETYIGLDIGYDSLKLVELKRQKMGLVLSNVVVEPCWDKDIKDFTDDKYFDYIRNMFQQHKIHPTSLVISASGQSVFTRFIKLPTLDKSKIDQIVQYEAQQQVPFPIDDVIWDYQLIGDWQTINEVDEASIVLVASKKEMIHKLITNFNALKVDVEYIDISPFALCNCIKFNEPSFDSCSLILDIGAKSTDMLVLENENIWCRSIPIAGVAFTQAIAKEFKISFEEAEKLKRESAVIFSGKGPMIGESPEKLRISRALTTTLARLLAEISRSVGFYRTYAGGEGIKNILLCGGSAAIQNIDVFFSSKFNINVRKLETTNNLDIAPGLESAVQENKHLIAPAIGLALRRATRCVMEINLLPKQLATQRDIARKKGYIIGCFVLTAIMFLAGIYYNNQWIVYEKGISAGLYEELRQLKAQRSKMEEAKKTVEDNHASLKKINSLHMERTYWTRLFIELQSIIPKECWLKQFSIRKNRGPKEKILVRIAGETTAPLGEIPHIKDKLEKSSFFSDVKIRSADDLTAVGTESKDIRRFEMTCNLNKSEGKKP